MPLPTVIYYHQIVRRPRPDHAFFGGEPTPDQFRASMQTLKERYTPISLDELARGPSASRRWRRRAVAITFDDGFRNNLIAARILHELGMTGTFFVLTGVLDGRFVPAYLKFAHIVSTRKGEAFKTPLGEVDFANVLSRRRWLLSTKEHLLRMHPREQDALLDEVAGWFGADPIDPGDEDYHYMSPADLRELPELGMTVGGHGMWHDKLSRCSDAELRVELIDACEQLAAAAGRRIEYFAYPNGRFDDRVLKIARERFKMAFGAQENLSPRNAHAYPRRRPGRNVETVLAPWYPLKRRAVRVIKRLLGEPVAGWQV